MKRQIILVAVVLILSPSTLLFSAEQKGPATPSPPVAATAEQECKPMFLEINTATEAQLKTLPGIGDEFAMKIIAGRPYANRDELKSREVLPPDAYERIKDLIVAEQPR